MKIIGCDFHPSYQQIAWIDTETGELQELRLEHEKGEARRFYEIDYLSGHPASLEQRGSSESESWSQ